MLYTLCRSDDALFRGYILGWTERQTIIFDRANGKKVVLEHDDLEILWKI